jgi:capsular polysaccharide transport system permease protein
VQNSLRHSFAIQRRVIGALLMREVITRFGRHNIGVLWLFVEPMIFTLGIATLWSLVGLGHGHGLSPVAFAVTGYSSVLLWRNIASRSIHAVQPNLALMHHRNVKVLDLFLSRALLEIAGASLSFVILGTVFCALGWMNPPVDILKLLGGWLILMWLGTALGVLVGSLSERSEVVEKLWGPFTYLLFPLSGAVFMVDWLPPSFRAIVLWVPMVHALELLRAGYFGAAVHAHYELHYVLGACLGMTFFGLAQARIVGRTVLPE